MKGVVLCGGQSLRMGKDKGLMIGAKKITWAQQAVSLFTKLELEVILSVNPQQYSSYKRNFYINTLVKDDETIPVKGPLLGILSVHQEYPGEDLLVLATDMINMDSEVLEKLYQTKQKQVKFDAYAYQGGKGIEPLCAIFTAKGLEKIMKKAKSSTLENFSMKHAIEPLNVCMLEVQPEWKPYFANMNTLSDLQKG